MALLYVTPFNSALLHPAIPVFASIMGALVGVSQLTHMMVLGTSICVVGSVFVILSQPSDNDNGGSSAEQVGETSSLVIGNTLLLMQSLAMAALLVYQKFVPSTYSPLKTTALYYSVGVAISIPVSITTMFVFDGWILPTATIMWYVLFGSVFVVGFNYAALSWANKIVSPTIPAASMMLQPPFSYFASRIFIASTYDTGRQQVIGGLVIVIGLVIALSDRPAARSTFVPISNAEDTTTANPDIHVQRSMDKSLFWYASAPHEADEVKEFAEEVTRKTGYAGV